MERKIIFILVLLVFVLVISGCSKCGNEVCDEKETKCNCPQDCGECSGSAGTCSEYYCNKNLCDTRISTNCCGNNIVEETETCSNCPNDIKCSTDTICCSDECVNATCILNLDCEEKVFYDAECEKPNTCDAECIYNIWSPTKTVDTYFQHYTAWVFHSYGEMYTLLHSSVKPESVEHLKVDIENYKTALSLGWLSCSYIETKNEKVNGNKATVDLVYKTSSMGFKNIETETVNLEMEVGLWRLKRIHL